VTQLLPPKLGVSEHSRAKTVIVSVLRTSRDYENVSAKKHTERTAVRSEAKLLE